MAQPAPDQDRASAPECAPPLEVSDAQITGLARILGPILERRLAERRRAAGIPYSKCNTDATLVSLPKEKEDR